jgi:hypothetical protein
MTISADGPIAGTNGPNGSLGLANGGSIYFREIDAGQRMALRARGREFAGLTGGDPCLLLIGRILGDGAPGGSTEQRVQKSCQRRFGFPTPEPERTINVILDSTGGPLDSAFRTVLFLSRYAGKINIYVPRRAKSASTLIAVGGSKIFMSPFGELGPLDTQIRDPRNPTDYISALDCYQSVDYVREFGFSTLSQALKQLATVTQGKLLLSDSLNAAAQFAIGSINPMLSQTRSLDFGAWGRSLKMGERYAQILLSRAGEIEQGKAERIALRLVYGYTHHLFPIDINEATDMGLKPEEMSEEAYVQSIGIVECCEDSQVCIEFIDERDEHEQPAERGGDSAAGQLPETGASAQTAAPAPAGPAPAGPAPTGPAPTAAAPTEAAPAEA